MVRSSLRSFIRIPSFAITVVLTIALGVGATTAMFSVVYATLLRPLPYQDASRLVVVWEKWQVGRDLKGVDPEVAARLAERSVINTDALPVWRSQNHVFEDIGAFSGKEFSVSGTGQPERVDGMVADSHFWRVLRVSPALGRTFTSDEDVQGHDEVAIISHALWQRRFNGDRSIVGKTIGLDGLPHVIAAVMPPGFHLVLPGASRDPDVIAPIPHNFMLDRKWALVMTVARLKPGITVESAQADMSAVVRHMAETNRRYKTRDANVVALADEVGHDSRLALLVLFGATLCVLLIGCANVANLLILRAASQKKQLAIRTALGAGRADIAKHVVIESLLLALAGGVAGLILAYWFTSVLLTFVPERLFPRLEDVGVNPIVLVFGLLVSMIVGVVSGIAPVWHILRGDRRGSLSRVLNEAQRTATVSRGQRALRRGLVIAQVAVAMVLLVGAGLLTETYLRLTRVDLGVKPENVLTFVVSLPESRYKTDVARTEFDAALQQRLESMPGVEAAGIGSTLPVQAQFTGSMTVAIEGRAPVQGEFVSVRTASPGLFRAAGIRLAYGRTLAAADARADVAVVNRALVRRFWPSASAKGPEPLGRKMQIGPRWCTVIGVVDDVKYSGPDRRAEPEAYVPLAYWPLGNVVGLVRASSNPLALAPAIRSAVRSVDPDLPVQQLRTLEEVVSRTTAPPRFRFVLIVVFAVLALVLATIGLYGVISQSVAQRTQEIGVRMALGARRSSIARMVLFEAMAVAGLGVAAGIVASLAATRLLAKFLFGVQATNLPTYVAVGIAVALASVVASMAPARRAMSADPAAVLRSQ